jgi:predicted acylesterase/phospholipase RssA/CRP-like cAMP-binding protein
LKTQSIKDIKLSEDSQNLIHSFLLRYFGAGISDAIQDLEYIKIKKGEFLFNQGEDGSDMYILTGGKLLALVDNAKKIVGEVIMGECVGETALLYGGKRTASILAARDSSLVKISQAKFETLWKKHPEIILNLSQTIIKRLDTKNRDLQLLQTSCKLISMVGLDKQSHIKLANDIAAYWKDKLRIQIIEEDLDGFETFSLKVTEAEQNNDLVIMLSTSNNEWNKLIVNNSDEICYVATESQHANYKDATLHNSIHEGRLILMYEENEVPTETTAWLTDFQPNKIQHCRKDHAEDIGRISRIITERAVCWVFSGGGAHGFAHLGAIRALLEKNVPIDIVGGTSIGSVIAGCLAQDWSYEHIMEHIRKDLSQNSPLNDFTLPMVSLLRGQKLLKLTGRYFGINIENTWKNFFCVASNLSNYQPEIFETGKLDRAITSSTSIPGILPPLLHNQSLLVDGGVLNNLPTDIMRTKHRGFVISIDLGSVKSRTITTQHRISNSQMMKNWFTKERKYVPSLMNVIMKSMTLGSIADAATKRAISDFYVNPQIKKGFLDWKAMDSICEQGYQETKKALEESDFITRLNLP